MPPTAPDAFFSVDEDGSIRFDLAAVDPDGDQLTYAIDRQTDLGTVSLFSQGTIVNGQAVTTSGSFRYSPRSEFFGTDTFDYTVSDGMHTSVGTVSIAITRLADDPLNVTGYAFRRTTDEGTPVGFHLIVNAGDLGPTTQPEELSLIEIDSPDNGTLAIESVDVDRNTNRNDFFTINYTYTPDAGFSGSDNFQIAVTNGTEAVAVGRIGPDGVRVPQSLTVTVNPVDDPTTIDLSSLVVNEDETISGTATFSDPDTDTSGFVWGTPTEPANGTLEFDAETGEFSYTGDENFNGTDSFVLSVFDSAAPDANLVATQTVSVTVNPVNDAPVVEYLQIVGDEGSVLSTQVVVSDVDGDPLTLDSVFEGTFVFGEFQFDELTGVATYTPSADYNGTQAFTIIASDGELEGRNLVQFDVTPVNDAPVADDVSVAGDEDTVITGQVTASDVDNDRDLQDIPAGDVLTFSLGTGPANGTVVVNDDGTFEYTGGENFNGSDSFTVVVSDGELTDTATVSVTVNPVNDAPVVEYLRIVGDEDSVLSTQVVVSDVDGDELTLDSVFEGTFVFGEFQFDELTGIATYTPSADYNGTQAFTIIASDGELEGRNLVQFDVTPVNDAPVADDVSVAGDEDTVITGQVTASDVDNDRDLQDIPAGDVLTFSLGTGPANGTVVVNDDGTFEYTGDENFNGSDSFTVVVSDGELTDTATVSVTVNPVNDAPVVEGAVFTIDENSPGGTAVGIVSATDVDGDSLTFSIVGGNEEGQFVIDATTGAITVATGALLDFETRSNYTLAVAASDDQLVDEAIVEIALNDLDEGTDPLAIDIDIDPRDRNNRVSVIRDRWLRVALIGSDDFDVRDIDLDSITFGVDGDDTGALRNRRGRFYGNYADVNRDGTRDLVLYFDLYQTGIFDDGFRLGQFNMTLRGLLDDGTEFSGTDMIDLTLFRRR